MAYTFRISYKFPKPMLRQFLFSFALPLFSLGSLLCRRADAPVMPDPVPTDTMSVEKTDYLALGDSYTKGQNVLWSQNFPNQLADSLRRRGFAMPAPRVIAQTGWRADQLQHAIQTEGADLADSVFSLVTLCIGVNNQYQHADFETYKVQFEQLLQTAIARTGGRPGRVIVVSIPDYAYTPFGQNSSSPSAISAEIDAYNAANKAMAQQYGVRYVDVTPSSRQGLAMPDWVANDGLHPSGKQYTEWVKLLLPVAEAALSK